MHGLVGALLLTLTKPHMIALFAGSKSDLAYQVSHWLIYKSYIFINLIHICAILCQWISHPPNSPACRLLSFGYKVAYMYVANNMGPMPHLCFHNKI